MAAPESQVPGKTILLVDDDALLRRLMEQALTQAGHPVMTAANGREALTLVSMLGDRIGLVVTDIRMPEMDGLELAHHLAGMKAPPPVLFITAFPATMASAIPGPILEKPFGPDRLLKFVARMLEPSLR
jgi:DNA-binding NtrC family response regulator